MKKSILTLLLISFAGLGSAFSQNLENPVLKGIADAGCIRYAGKYYLGGVATYGDFFVSNDLTHWDNRIHVFDLDNEWTHGTGAKNNQVHADDISYSGGLFHLLFSVNYWGQDRHIVHITHATSPNIEGPFKEVREDQWYENRIDPMIFQDEDGSLYLYMVKFTDGNTIWGRPLNQDFSFAGDAVQQFSSQQGTWETLDNRVAEGPFVIKYRGKYYMMYNANHTAPEYGNYHLGVCEAPSPLTFNPGGKYPQPVVGPNTEPVNEQFTDLLRYGSKGYNNIDLTKDEIHFTLDALPTGSLAMLIAQRGGCKVKLNGQDINPGERAEYAYYPVKAEQLRVGDNIIKVEKEQGSGRMHPSLSHLYLYESPAKDQQWGEVLVTPGQPNIVRGPNGWEWWLVYMANQGWNRHQFVDRIHFVNDRMTVDGITGKDTPGFHPQPAKPQFEGTSLDGLELGNAYLLEITSKRGGVPEEWRIEYNFGMLTAWQNKILVKNHVSCSVDDVKELIKTASADEIVYVSYCEGYDEYGPYFKGWDETQNSDKGMVLPSSGKFCKNVSADDYAFSVDFSNETPESGQYGVYANYVDMQNFVRVTVDAKNQKLITENVVKGKVTREETPLSETRVHYPDLKYTDSFEKQYRFDCETFVDGVEYPHLDASHDGYASALSIAQNERIYRDDMAGMMTLEYLDSKTDKWMPISYEEQPSTNAAWQKVSFPQVKTRALRMINKDPRQNDRNIYKVKTSRAFQQDLQLRIEKRGLNFYVFCGDRLMTTVSLKKQTPSSVYLFNESDHEILVKNTLYYVVK